MKPISATVLAVLAAGAVVGGGACREDATPTTTSATASSGGGDGAGAPAGGGDAGGGGRGGGATNSGTGAGASSSGSTGATTSTGSSGSGGFDTCGIGSPGTGGSGGGSASGRVRVVAANLSSGDAQSYDSGHGVRILQGLEADVVLLQEMNFGTNSTTAIGTLVDQVCDGACKYVRGPQEQIPNGVLSKLPILACGSWADPEVQNRNFVWARIDVPGDADLWAISVHLLTSNASARAREVTALLGHMAGAIPASDLVVLGGDLNTGSRGEAAVTTLAGVFATAGPHPADQDGNENTNAPRDEPYDWVLADQDLRPLQVPVSIGGTSFTAGAVIDTRVHQPISDLAPALQGDSAAPSMQHMAVVKDFLIEGP